jgi:hypothetical protein
MTERNYHFAIPQSNILDFVTAASFTDAKAKAFDEYGPWWNLIEWLDPDDAHERGTEPVADRAG